VRIIYSCPDCQGDLDDDGYDLWCPSCQRSVPWYLVAGDDDDDRA
jgi:hypothetical protein